MVRKVLAGLLCLALVATAVVCGVARVRQKAETVPEEKTEVPVIQEEKEPEPVKEPEPEPEPEPELEPEPEPEPEQTDFILSFAGDCCIASDIENYGAPGTLVDVVGENYAYPFANALVWFGNDDFTMVNLECALTESDGASDKMFRFKAPPAYAKILTAGSVECVTLANNHSGDFGQTGYEDTIRALEAEQVTYVTDGGSRIYETESGLRVGVFAGWREYGNMETALAELRADGADVIVAAFHAGTEGSYSTNYEQDTVYYRAIDCGADIVFGCHPHVLQKVERYGNGIILFSMGNFVFGGNRYPKDQDTAILRQHFTKNPDGTFTIGETEMIPFNLSSLVGYNDFQPKPYEKGSADYDRVLAKLNGTYDGPDIIPDYAKEEEESTETGTETEPGTEEAPEPEETEPPGETEE